MNDILITKDGDMFVGNNGDIVLTRSIAQAIMIRLRWFFGEWKINPNFGVPYYEDIFGKNPNLRKIEAIISEQIYDVEGVERITKLEIKVDPATRNATIVYAAESLDGPLNEEVAIYG